VLFGHSVAWTCGVITNPHQGHVLEALRHSPCILSVPVCRLKLPLNLQYLDDKAWAKLDQTYSLNSKTVSFLQQHDELCDLLSQLALEVKQALAVDAET